MELSESELSVLIDTAAQLSATITLIRTGNVKPYLNKSEAFRRYGRKNIEKWINRGLLTIRKDGDHSAAWRLDLMEIEFIKAGEHFYAIPGWRR